MKKFFFILTGIFLALAVSSTAFAGDEERIDLNQQPSQNTESAINSEETVTDLSVALNDNPGVKVGSSMPLTVSAGGRMTLVSGQSIILKPGTRVEAGGNLLVKVTAKQGLKRNKKKIVQEKVETVVPLKTVASIEIEKTFRIYPMPPSGTIVEAMNEVKGILPLRLRVSEHFPGLIYIKNVNTPPLNLFITETNPSDRFSMGWGERSETIKVLRT